MIHLERCEAEMILRYFHCTCGLYSSCRFVQHCLCSHMFIVAFPVLVAVSMAHASFVDLPVWRDRPPSKAFFDFNRYEYRLQLCTNCCRMRYRGLQQDAGGAPMTASSVIRIRSKSFFPNCHHDYRLGQLIVARRNLHVSY